MAGLRIVDPINLRSVTGSRNMQVWTMHDVCRYAFLGSDGRCMFDLPSAAHLAEGLKGVDEVRPSLAFDYMVVGPRGEEMAARLAAEVAALAREHGGGERRLAMDRADLLAVQALAAAGVRCADGKRCSSALAPSSPTRKSARCVSRSPSARLR